MIGTKHTPPQRFLPLGRVAVACWTALLAAVLPTACGGGGGGGSPQAAPVIVTASVVGSGTPASGHTLLLTFSTDVTLVAGALLTDEDFTLPTGASLGAVGAAPTATSSNSVSITLGAGVAITLGTTTIALATGNDAVAGVGAAPTGGGDPVVIGDSDGVPPVISRLTIADIDTAFNGTGAAGGVLQAPSNGWTIDATYSDSSGIATGQTLLTADVAVSTSSGTLAAGSNLRPFLTETSADNTSATYTVPSTVSFPAGNVTLTCVIVDQSGLSSTPSTLAFAIKAFTAALQPFETTTNASQVWYLDFARDVESFTTSALGGGYQVSAVAGSNGRADFDDLLRVLGLHSATPIANVTTGVDSNQYVSNRLQANLLLDLASLHSGANISFTLTQPSGSFGSSSSVPYATLGYSQISIAGASTTTGVLGLAIFDPSNTTQNDNTLTDFSGNRLGVFLHTIVDAGMRSGASSNFRLTFDTFAPDQGGTPIGDAGDGLDDDRLLGIVNDARTTAITTALAELARFTATIVAHECGHSVGLVANGAMPTGLFGNDTTNFPNSSDGHIYNAPLFPSGSINIMSPALSYTNATSSSTAFNSLNLAYLREQVFYNGN